MDASYVLDEFGKTIYRIAYSYLKNNADADDVLQNVIIKYIIKGDSINDETKLRSWLIKVTVNCCKDLIKSSWYKTTIAIDENTYISDNKNDTSYVYDAVMCLPLKYRQVVHFFTTKN